MHHINKQGHFHFCIAKPRLSYDIKLVFYYWSIIGQLSYWGAIRPPNLIEAALKYMHIRNDQLVRLQSSGVYYTCTCTCTNLEYLRQWMIKKSWTQIKVDPVSLNFVYLAYIVLFQKVYWRFYSQIGLKLKFASSVSAIIRRYDI